MMTAPEETMTAEQKERRETTSRKHEVATDPARS